MTKSVSFSIAYWLLLVVLLVYVFTPIVAGNLSIAGIALDGIVRFLGLGIIAIVILDHLKRFSFVFNYERRMILIMISFFLIMIVQFFLVDDKMFNIQGAVKYLFYFGFIAISLYGAIIHSDKVIHTILNIATFLFLLVLIFYPQLIVESGQDPVSRLLDGDSRMSYLLMAANEDAHFMVTLMMFTYLRLRKSKIILAGVAAIFFLALIYNGTRTALFMALILPVLFYVLYKRNFVVPTVTLVCVLMLAMPKLVPFLEKKFEEDLRLLEESDKVMSGEEVGGSMSWRIAHVWLPTLNYTWEESPLIGNGSNGWDITALKLLNHEKVESPHNIFVWAFVNWGLIGLTIFFIFLGIPISYVWKTYWREQNQEDSLVEIALLCAWIEFVVWSLFANSYGLHGWVILSLLIVFSIAVKYKNFSRSLIEMYESSDSQYA